MFPILFLTVKSVQILTSAPAVVTQHFCVQPAQSHQRHVTTSSRQQANCVLPFAFTCLSQKKSYVVTSNWNRSWVHSVPPFYQGEHLWAAMWRMSSQKSFSLPGWWIKSTSAHEPGMDRCSSRINSAMFQREGLLRELLRAQGFKCWNTD